MILKNSLELNGRIDSTAGNAVKARDGYGGWHGGWSGGGGVGFPSLEAALLSLAFLTFAVFLIDLIQVGTGKQQNITHISLMVN